MQRLSNAAMQILKTRPAEIMVLFQLNKTGLYPTAQAFFDCWYEKNGAIGAVDRDVKAISDLNVEFVPQFLGQHNPPQGVYRSGKSTVVYFLQVSLPPKEGFQTKKTLVYVSLLRYRRGRAIRPLHNSFGEKQEKHHAGH